MENGIWAKKDYKSYTAKHGPLKVCKETYGLPTS